MIYTIAGIAFFMFGMTLASKYLQRLAANRITELLGKLSDRPFLGVGVGVLLTVLIQSSGAVTSMLVGLGTAGVINLRQVMSVILGTAIGTTVTVQLLSLNVAQYGLAIFSFSFTVYFLTDKRVTRQIFGVLMGFGLIFWGLELIGVGTESLRNSSIFVEYLDYLSENPIAVVAVSSIFTAIVHSSAATIGLAMSLTYSGLISFESSLYWVYGANIGTTATALLAAAGGNYIGRQVAWAHCFYKVIGVGVFYFLTPYFASLFSGISVQRDIANAHTLFNIVLALFFFPFIKIGSNFIEKLFPPRDGEREFSVKYLKRGELQSLSVVLAHAQREILRMGDMVLEMVKLSKDLLLKQNGDLQEYIREQDNRVDLLNREISLYISESIDSENEDLPKKAYRMILFASDLESVADVVDKNILELARKKHSLKVDFSSQGWSEINEIHENVVKIVSLSLSCFQLADKELASKVVFHKRQLRKLEKKFREAHIERLAGGEKDSIKTSSIHLDLLSDYRRIVGLTANHAYYYLKEGDKYNILPRREDVR